MKLATYHDGSRDGQLVVVSRDLATAQFASGSATRLQQALDDWNFVAPQLEDLYQDLNQGRARRTFAFEPARCMSPLPRAPEWLVCDAWMSGAPATGTSSPRLIPGSCHGFGDAWSVAGPYDDPDIDFEAGMAAITGDVAAGADTDTALAAVRLVMLCCGIHLQTVAAEERSDHLIPLSSRPRIAFSPVAVTLDELGHAWAQGKPALRLDVMRGEKPVARCPVATGMPFSFGEIIARACRVRGLGAGSVLGTGPLQNDDRARGYTSIAAQRAAESIDGAATTPYLRLGESVSVDMRGPDGRSLCGRIVQTLGGAPADTPTSSEGVAPEQ